MRPLSFSRAAIVTAVIASTIAAPAPASGQSIRERLAARRTERRDAALPAGTRIVRDVAYGSDEAQRFDVYAPANAHGAPVIFMVHGGGWRNGDKDGRNIVANKAGRWLPRGFVFVTTNYRMLPGTKPIDQARDVARAIAAVQARAAQWGGDGTKLVVMGHSAGAHLVALLASSPEMVAQAGAKPWLGTIPLESAAMNVVTIMTERHPRLYDDAFGTDTAYWRAASPFHALAKAGAPMMIVCSTKRADACGQAQRYAAKANALGMRTAVHGENLTHGEVNEDLGKPGAYTDAVEAFMRTLDPAVARRLDARVTAAR